MTDPIADLLTRIRNGIKARKEYVMVPASKVKEQIVKILKEEGFVSQYVMEEKAPQSEMKVFLKYDMNRDSAIRRIKRVSRPGRRVYHGYREIKPFLKGIGLRILSTPQGMITDKKARANKVGGEVICEVN
ncbi:30S ribosomal protein S8 [bacterium]|nr:30S ribosomal protein S8 [bacterium]